MLLIIFMLIPALTVNVSAQTKDTLTPKNVMMLVSDAPGLPFYESLINGIKKKINGNYNHPVNFFIDYAEIVRHNDEQYISDFFEYYNKKYKNNKIDLFISLGPSLLPYVEKYGGSFLDSVPKIFMDINKVPAVKNNEFIKNSIGVLAELDIDKNIQCALNVKPETKNIILVAGCSIYDNKFLELYKSVLKKYESKYNVTYLTGLTLKELINKMKNLPEHSIVLMSVYQKDTNGTIYNSLDVLSLLYNSINVPIFELFEIGIGFTAGGYLFSSDNIGLKIGEFSSRILEGNIPDSLQIYKNAFSRYIFNWKELKRWNINEDNLPEGSIVINKELTFFEQYYVIIIIAINFAAIETLLIILLLFLYRKQRKLTVKIFEQESRYQELVDYNRLYELSEITASLSHQLNQPLTAILSSSQASLRFLKNDKYDKQLFEEILTNIVEDVKRASEIIISLRSMMKKETREKKRANINRIAYEVFTLFNSQASVKDIIVDTDFDNTEPVVKVDATLIQQVILNLLLNASEALEEKERNKNITLTTEVRDNFVTVSVSDNGKGIDKKLKNDILKPFFTTKSKGLGIGLAICKSIVEDHEGKLVFENNASGGATFSFKLKAVQ